MLIQTKNLTYEQLVQQVLTGPEVETLLKNLNYQFSRTELLVTALTHTSFQHEMTHLEINSSERLEFLGDSLINFLVAQKIYRESSQQNEGVMSQLRSAIVCRDHLALCGRVLGLQHALLLGAGEASRMNSQDPHLKDSTQANILSDAFESLWGAIIEDTDLTHAAKLFDGFMDFYQRETGNSFTHYRSRDEFDSKTRLQELTLMKFKEFPLYKQVDFDQQKGFMVELWINGALVGSVQNPSKRKAEKILAQLGITFMLDQLDQQEVLI
jgi:ribonuclease-3